MVRRLAEYLRSHPSLGRAALRCLPDVKRRIGVEHIGPFQIRLRRNRSFWLRSPLTLEARMMGYMRLLIRPGDVVYDVGANIGLYSRFALHFGAGQVYAFEPMSENLELLRANVGLARDHDGARRIHVMPMALGDADGTETLQVDDVMSATASLDRVAPGHVSYGRGMYGLGPKTEQVRVARLDTLVETEQLPPPQFIKVDVEGAEALMLRGAQHVLAAHRPRLTIELHSTDVAHEVLSILDGHGYTCFGYAKDGSDKPAVYQRIKPADAARLEPYDQIVASPDAADLEQPIEEFH